MPSKRKKTSSKPAKFTKPTRPAKKPVRSVRRKISAATRKKLSEASRRYWRFIRALKRRRGLKSTVVARQAYNRFYRYGRDRFSRLVFPDIKSRPRFLRARDVRKYGKVMERGRDKGMIVVYYDNFMRRVVKGRYALRFRREAQVMRVALVLRDSRPGDFRLLHVRYWPVKAKERGRLTWEEAVGVSRKIMRDRRRNKELYLYVRQYFGEESP